MLRKARLLAVAAAGLIVLATTAPAANAYRSLIIERGGAIRQVSSTQISFVGGILIVSCNLTLNGELRTGPFTGELPITAGQVTRIEWQPCEGGEILTILNVPWTVEIERLLEPGREARISGIRPEAITGGLVSLVESGAGPVGFRLELEAITCLYGGGGESPSALLPLTRTESREGRFYYSLGALSVLESVRFRKHPGDPETCPASGFIRGRFSAAEPAQTAIFQ